METLENLKKDGDQDVRYHSQKPGDIEEEDDDEIEVELVEEKVEAVENNQSLETEN